MNRRLFWTLQFALCGIGQPALAQTGQALAPEKFTISEGGVDMRTGRYALSEDDLSIGDADGLKLTRLLSTAIRGHDDVLGNFSHNWDIVLTAKSVNLAEANFDDGSGPDSRVEVSFGGRTETFDKIASYLAYQLSSRGNLGKLAYIQTSSGLVYTFAASDGTRIRFRPISAPECSDNIACAFADQVISPNGTVYTLSYDSFSPGTANATRLPRVVSSRGYALVFEYGQGVRAGVVSKACAINLSSAFLGSSNSCPADAKAYIDYSYADFRPAVPGRRPLRLASASGPTGLKARFEYSDGAQGLSMRLFRGTDANPWLTNQLMGVASPDIISEEIVSAQAFASGRTLNYLYDDIPTSNGNPGIAGGTYTDEQGHSVKVKFGTPRLPSLINYPILTRPPGCYGWNGTSVMDFGSECGFSYRAPVTFGSVVFQVTPGPIEVTDRNNRVYRASYCDPNYEAGAPAAERFRCLITLLQSTTDPEGVKTVYETAWATRNTTKTTVVPKPASGEAALISTAMFSDCSNLLTCAKPLSRTDPKGGVTEWTYAPEHGGLLTETGPAPTPGGIRPQTRYRYAQRQAWVKNASSAYVQTGQPIWLLVRKASCRTTAALGDGCTGGASDELVTTYDYGPDAGPNNLLLRGMVDDANGAALRTCYSYDWQGNRVSETKPGAGLVSCL